MSTKKLVISEEILEDLAFERSKWWSNFLEEVQMTERDDPIHLNDIEKVYGNDSDGERTDLDEAEEASELDADEPAALDATTAQGKKSFIETSEVQDILNVTVTILQEHKRKWQEAGLERIMNTFDSVRIEKEVGGWMRLNHTTNIFAKHIPASETDSDSMLSSETADYIRSTRKKCMQRRRSCMASIGRFKKFQRIHHKHGTVVEATTYRAYNCNCYKFRAMMEEDERRRKRPFPKEEMVGGTAPKKRDSFRPQSERRLQRFNGEYSSSSDSDYVSHEKPSLLTSMLPPSPNRESLYKKHHALCAKSLAATDGHRNRLRSTTSSKFETPPKSSFINRDFTKTAPSKISKERQSSKKVLEKLCVKEDEYKNDNIEEMGDDDSSAEHNTTFEGNLQRAIELSLKTKKTNQMKRKSSVKEPQRDTSSASIRCTASTMASCTQTMKSSNASAITSKQSTSETTLKPVNHDREETKENTFLMHQENICNSTALTSATAAVREQLPSIAENSVIISSTRSENGARKKIVGLMPRIDEYSLSASDGKMRKVEPQFKNVLHSTAVDNLSTHKEKVIPTTPTATGECSLSASDGKMRNVEPQFKNVLHSTALNNLSTHKEKVIPTTPTATGECSLSASDGKMCNVERQFKNVLHSTALKNLSTHKDKVIPTTPSKQQRARKSGTPTCNGQKRCSIANGRKSINDANKVLTPSHSSNSAEARRSATSTDIEKKAKQILVYKPQNNHETPTGYFQVTREILSSVIGDRCARRFMKYHLGQLTFPKTSTVYFCPPDVEFLSSDSDDDPLEMIGRCGALCVSECAI